MHQLSAEQVHAWRLRQQCLLQPSDRQDWGSVVSQICGVQAQVFSAAELAIWARIYDLQPADVEHALWQARTLVKTWAMRGTLHLLSADELPLYVAARGAHAPRRPPSWYSYHGVTPEELALIIEGVPAVLSADPMTREQLAQALAERVGSPKLRELLRSGWGALLKPSAFQGQLCFGPSQGQHVTFVRPEQWLGAWQALEPEQAWKEIARRYLTAYGPAASDDFARWWGIEPGPARRLFRALAPELEAVEVAGWQAWALQSTLQQLQGLDAPRVVRLLPAFDPYTIALYRQPFVLDARFKARVSRAQGWISAVVLAAGRIVGTWELEKRRAGAVVSVDLFDPPGAEVRSGIEAQAQRLGTFVGADVAVAYA